MKKVTIMKKCVISNYIPHHTPKKPDFNKWFKTYYYDLLCLYDTLNQILTERDESSEHDFKRFTMFIYSCSSKYIQN